MLTPFTGVSILREPIYKDNPVPYSHPVEKLMRKIENFKAPVIAMITGTVWGGAFDLAVTCDMIIGTPDSEVTEENAYLYSDYIEVNLDYSEGYYTHGEIISPTIKSKVGFL